MEATGDLERDILRELEDSTSHAYKLLRTWCFSEQPLAIFKSIGIIALSYVQAIESSIKAAQDGFKLSEDVIASLEPLDTNKTQCQEYLRGVVDLARQGKETAERTNCKFRDVRITVWKHVQDAKKQRSLGAFDTSLSSEKQLKEFEECISSYISWWTRMDLMQRSHVTRLGDVAVKYHALRVEHIINLVKGQRQAFIDYTNKIQLIQNINSDFIIDLKNQNMQDTTPAQSPGIDADNTVSIRSPIESQVTKHVFSIWQDTPKLKSTILTEEAVVLEDTRKRIAQSVASVLGTAVDIGHEALYVGVEFLDLVPVPGLQTAAKTLLNIWDAVQDVDIINLECLRLIKRCAEILLSIRGIVHKAGDQVGTELRMPLVTLEECFSGICCFVLKIKTHSWTKRYLKRDEIHKAITECHQKLHDALILFLVSVQVCTLDQVQKNAQRV